MNLWRLGRLGGGEKLKTNCGGSAHVETVIYLEFEGKQMPLSFLSPKPGRCGVSPHERGVRKTRASEVKAGEMPFPNKDS